MIEMDVGKIRFPLWAAMVPGGSIGWFTEPNLREAGGAYMERGVIVRNVIDSQAEVWENVLKDPIPRWGLHGRVLCVGSGTSYYLAQVVAHLGQQLGLDITACPTQDVILEQAGLLKRFDAMVVISRSGHTSEALWSVDTARLNNTPVLGVTCNDSSPLLPKVQQAWEFPGAHDHTVVMIRSFTSMLLAFERALAHEANAVNIERELQPVVRQARPFIQTAYDVIRENTIVPPRRVYILGAGARFGIAQEGALKCLEMSNENASAYGPLEFRHGPWGSVTADDMVVMLGQVRYAVHERRVLRDLSQRTQRLLVVAQDAWFGEESLPCSRVVLPVGDDMWNGFMAVVPLQWLGWSWALSQGMDPDAPRKLTQVVDLNYGRY